MWVGDCPLLLERADFTLVSDVHDEQRKRQASPQKRE